MIAALRVLDADRVAQRLASDEVIELPDPATIFEAWLDPAVLAAIERRRAAGVETAGLGLDVDDAGGTETVLRRQCAGDQRYRIGQPCLQRLAEDIDALGQLHAIETVLQVGVLAADV